MAGDQKQFEALLQALMSPENDTRVEKEVKKDRLHIMCLESCLAYSRELTNLDFPFIHLAVSCGKYRSLPLEIISIHVKDKNFIKSWVG